MKRSHSIFFKITLMVIAVILITIFAIGLFGVFLIQFHFPLNLPVGIEHYINFIIKEIGIPPDRAKMEQVCREQGLGIFYRGPEFESAYRFPESGKHVRYSASESDHVSYGFQRGTLFAKKETGGHVIIIAISVASREHVGFLYVIALIIILTIVLSVLNLRIRRLLKPVHHLMTGVTRIQEGDFSYRVPVTQSDELGRLSGSFNRMTQLVSDMLVSKDQLLLDVSHELRSPLTRMKIALEFITDPKAKQSLAEDLNEMEHMILELLETERMKSEFGKGSFSMTDIIALIDGLAGDYSDKSPGLECRFPGRPVPLRLDKMRINMLFRNILDNAFRYSPPDGPPVVITVTDGQDSVKIEVRDSGRGIPEKDLANIFEPFYRTDMSRSKETGGYGLGLYICRKIMDYHGGEISIESAENKGTAIILDFKKTDR
ncbi:MAG: HAMP domain-containing histidine kinase [Spirochaetales bacterium]|nr:HAMP domain-containing histidine kinase [Spirochaetales bacterium]